MEVLKSKKKLFGIGAMLMSTLLTGIISYADVIVQPGVIIGSGAGPGESMGIVDPDGGAADTEQSEENTQNTDTASQENESAADSSEIRVIYQFKQEGAPGEDTGSETSETAESDPAALSLASPNTLVPTADANIFYINGRTIDITKPSVALTYDDGPQTSAGNRIMDVMAQYGQKCTFFMVGERVAARATEVNRMAAEGHELANHTYNHVYLNRVGAETIRNQVDACNNIIEQVSGVRPALMRLPGGNKNETVIANVNMPIILWNIDTRDWSHRDAEKTKAAVIGKVKNGDIVLMHELYDSTALATETIVPTLVGQGFQLVTVSELAAIRGVTPEAGHIYYSF